MEKLSPAFLAMLASVRSRIFTESAYLKGQTFGPLTFAAHLLQVLDETDFAIIEAYEKAVGPEEALKWLRGVIDELGAKLVDEEPSSGSGAA